jgi:hypothetical protein
MVNRFENQHFKSMNYPKSKLTKLQKALRKKHTRVRSIGKNRSYCSLTIDSQEFDLVELMETKRADWFADMLAIALSKLVEHHTLGKVI